VRPAGRAQRTATRAMAAATSALLVVGVAAAVVQQRDRRTPEEDLRRALAFVQEHKTARFTATFVDEYGSGTGGADEAGVGEQTTSRSRGEGVLSLPYESRIRLFEVGYVNDAIVVRDGVYTRAAETGEDIEAQAWSFHGWDDGAEELAAVPDEIPDDEAAAIVAAQVMTALGGPLEIITAMQRMENLERVSAHVVRGTLDPKVVLPEGLKEAVPDDVFERVTFGVELTTGDGGGLDRIRLEMVDRDPDQPSRSTVDVVLSRWGDPVDLSLPAPATLDRTPSIAEDDVRAFSASLQAYVPSNLPDGWHLQWASVTEADEEFGTCRSLDLGYAGPGDVGSLDVTVSEADCPFDTTVTKAGEIVEGGDDFAGLRTIGGDAKDLRQVHVDIGRSRIQLVSTGLDATALRAMVKALVPLDLAKQPIELDPLPPTAG
jgi:hypothetical protein